MEFKSTLEIEIEKKAHKLFGDNHDLAMMYKIENLYDEDDEERKVIVDNMVEQLRKQNLKLKKELLSLGGFMTYDQDGNLVEADVEKMLSGNTNGVNQGHEDLPLLHELELGDNSEHGHQL